MKKTINVLAHITLVVVVVGIILTTIYSALWPNHYTGIGPYNHISCSHAYACVHEAGHALDHNLSDAFLGFGFVSSTEEFRTAIDEFTETCENTDPYCEFISGFPGLYGNEGNTAPHVNGFVRFIAGLSVGGGWGGYFELYADIYRKWQTEGLPLPGGIEKFFYRDLEVVGTCTVIVNAEGELIDSIDCEGIYLDSYNEQ